jgi:hypothetical protein
MEDTDILRVKFQPDYLPGLPFDLPRGQDLKFSSIQFQRQDLPLPRRFDDLKYARDRFLFL